MKPGAGTFISRATAIPRADMTVHYYAPPKMTRSTPVLFVLHGEKRDAKAYRNRWMPMAKREDFVLLAPEFNSLFYPAYNLGQMLEEAGQGLRESEFWAFQRLEEIFDEVRAATALETSTYGIYGHSAGAQFVHRMVLFHPEARFRVAVAANAGWYTVPRLDRPFPYGLVDAPAGEETLRQALNRRLTVLLGEDDVDPDHALLRRTPAARQQGEHRLDRGRAFFRAAKRLAKHWETPFRWKLEVVPGAAHRDRDMATAALRRLLRRSATPSS